jgi:hypothetical protein
MNAFCFDLQPRPNNIDESLDIITSMLRIRICVAFRIHYNISMGYVALTIMQIYAERCKYFFSLINRERVRRKSRVNQLCSSDSTKKRP